MTSRRSLSSGPTPTKRPRLEESDDDSEAEGPSLEPVSATSQPPDADSDSDDHCVICLQMIVDRSILPGCAHDRFCFECIEMWASQSRKCPLCTAAIGSYLIHNIRSQYDFSKHYLPPLRTSPLPVQSLSFQRHAGSSRGGRRVPQIEWGRNRREDLDELDRAIDKRRWIYRHNLYAKHVASNSFTRYRPFPTPAQFAASPDLVSRTTAFIRRELQVWRNLDVEFLTSFILALMKSVDIRSESAVKLLAEFLDMDEQYTEGGRKLNAEHFAHELYSYLRSPYRDLSIYDTVVQYDRPENVPPPPARQRHDRWVPPPRSRSRSPEDLYRRRRSGGGSEDPIDRSPRELSASPGRRPHPRQRSSSQSPDRHYRRRRRRSKRKGKTGDREISTSRSPSPFSEDEEVGPRRGGSTRPRSADSRLSTRSKSPQPYIRSTSGQPVPITSDPSGDPSLPNSPIEATSKASPPSDILQTNTPTVSKGISIKGISKLATTKLLQAGGIAIKGQAGNFATKDQLSLGILTSERNDNLPDLLQRMSDPSNVHQGKEHASVPEGYVSPSVADIMERTRAQLAAKRTGQILDDSQEPSSTSFLPMDRNPSSTGIPLDVDRRSQLMARLEEERQKYRTDSSVDLEMTADVSYPAGQSSEALDASDLLRRETLLRTRAKLRVKLMSERKHAPAKPVETAGEPIPEAGARREEGLRSQLRRRQSLHLEQDLRARLKRGG